MEGFQVLTLEDTLSYADIFITTTGNFAVNGTAPTSVPARLGPPISAIDELVATMELRGLSVTIPHKLYAAVRKLYPDAELPTFKTVSRDERRLVIDIGGGSVEITRNITSVAEAAHGVLDKIAQRMATMPHLTPAPSMQASP